MYHRLLEHAIFFTSFDDFSHAIWVYLINHKNEASEGFVNFYMVKTQFGKEIKRLRSDNGGAFTSSFMLEFYAKHCIILETSCAHTTQQNGVVKRKHIHILILEAACDI